MPPQVRHEPGAVLHAAHTGPGTKCCTASTNKSRCCAKQSTGTKEYRCTASWQLECAELGDAASGGLLMGRHREGWQGTDPEGGMLQGPGQRRGRGVAPQQAWASGPAYLCCMRMEVATRCWTPPSLRPMPGARYPHTATCLSHCHLALTLSLDTHTIVWLSP